MSRRDSAVNVILPAAGYSHLIINAILCQEAASGGDRSQKLDRHHVKVAPVASIFWEGRRAVFAGSVTANFKQIEGYIVKLNHPNVVFIYLKNRISIIKGLGVVGAMRAGVGAGLPWVRWCRKVKKQKDGNHLKIFKPMINFYSLR